MCDTIPWQTHNVLWFTQILKIAPLALGEIITILNGLLSIVSLKMDPISKIGGSLVN